MDIEKQSIEYVKKMMGFTNHHNTCQDCMHCMVYHDPDDHSKCFYNPSVSFIVDPLNDFCNQYENGKEKEQT